MATYNKFQDFVEQLAEGRHDFNADTFKLALTNSAPTAGMAILSEVTQISGTNGYTTGGTALTGVTSVESGGTHTVQANQVVFTAAGGTMATFRYVVLYNDTPSEGSDDNPLIAWWDYGSGVSLADTETFTVKFNNASPGTIFTLV